MLVANRSRTPLTSTTSISAADSLDRRTAGGGDSITRTGTSDMLACRSRRNR